MSLRRNTHGVSVSWVLVAILTLVTVIGFVKQQDLRDWYKLQAYTPPAAVSQLAIDTTMTDLGKKLYYVNHPELVNRQNFSNFCPVGAEQSVVLGCYTSGDNGIHLLQVDNEELLGVEQVTAAHEMLHAAYDRLSGSEQARIGAILQQFFDNELANEKVKKQINSYTDLDAVELRNEMHSIIGTQIREIPASLEAHYSLYFIDRQKVVAFYDDYEEAFTSRQERIDAYDSQLQTWKKQIDAQNESIAKQRTELESRGKQLDAQRANGDYDGYNSGVDTYNSKARAYNTALQALRSLIDRYNETVEKRNAIAFEERSLVQAISAEPVPQN